MKPIRLSALQQAALVSRPQKLNAVRLLAGVVSVMPEGAQVLVSDDRQQATVQASLPELCRVAAHLDAQFLHSGLSYNELYLCQRGKSTWLYLSTRADRTENQLRCGVVNFNTNKLPISKFTLQ